MSSGTKFKFFQLFVSCVRLSVRLPCNGPIDIDIQFKFAGCLTHIVIRYMCGTGNVLVTKCCVCACVFFIDLYRDYG